MMGAECSQQNGNHHGDVAEDQPVDILFAQHILLLYENRSSKSRLVKRALALGFSRDDFPMADPITLAVSALALSLSGLIASLTLLRKDTVKMKQHGSNSPCLSPYLIETTLNTYHVKDIEHGHVEKGNEEDCR